MTEPTGPVESKPAETPTRTEPGWGDVMAYPLAAVVALIGAGIGAYIVKLALQAGVVALPVVGLFAGWGTSLVSRKGSWWIGLIAGVMALMVGVYAQWSFFRPFSRIDPSFGYFLAHFFELKGFFLLLHGVSVALAVWLGARK